MVGDFRPFELARRRRPDRLQFNEVPVVVAPILLGDGVRLFDHPGGTEVVLERTAVEVEPTGNWLGFRVSR